MCSLRVAIIVGAVLALMPEQTVRAHGTKPRDAALTTEHTTSSETADTEIGVTIDPDASAADVVHVTLGAHFHLTVHGAGANELHLHGYDVAVRAEPDQPALIIFDASHTGRFPLEMHVEDDIFGKGEKAVLYIEVRKQ